MIRTGLLDEVMPKYPGRILQDPHVSGDHSGIPFNHWTIVAGLGVK